MPEKKKGISSVPIETDQIQQAIDDILCRIRQVAKDCEKAQELKSLTSALKDIRDLQSVLHPEEEEKTGVIILPQWEGEEPPWNE